MVLTPADDRRLRWTRFAVLYRISGITSVSPTLVLGVIGGRQAEIQLERYPRRSINVTVLAITGSLVDV